MLRLLRSLALMSAFIAPIAHAEVVLLAPSDSTSIDVKSRLLGLGHTVVESDPSTWGPGFDYSLYDVVAFQFNSRPAGTNPADIGHLVNAVNAGEVGVLFFRGYGAEETAVALGLFATNNAPGFSSPTNLTILNNTHPITQNLSLGIHNLGFDFMANYQAPGPAPSALVLANGPGATPALMVHYTLRVVALPFYGHIQNYNNETAESIDLTGRAVGWAGAISAIPESSSLTLFVMIGACVLIGQLVRKFVPSMN
jgi:hypothetical protein